MTKVVASEKELTGIWCQKVDKPGVWKVCSLEQVYTKTIIFVFFNQNICCGYSKELFQ